MSTWIKGSKTGVLFCCVAGVVSSGLHFPARYECLTLVLRGRALGDPMPPSARFNLAFQHPRAGDLVWTGPVGEAEADEQEGGAWWERQDQARGDGWSITMDARCGGEKARNEPRKKGMETKCHLYLQNAVTCINYASDLLLEAPQAVPTQPPDPSYNLPNFSHSSYTISWLGKVHCIVHQLSCPKEGNWAVTRHAHV